MKKLLLITALLIPSLALANEKASCEQMESLARSIMDARQSGIPLKKVMDIMKLDKAARAMTIYAYETPAYQVKENQQRKTDEFANEFYLECLKSEIKE